MSPLLSERNGEASNPPGRVGEVVPLVYPGKAKAKIQNTKIQKYKNTKIQKYKNTKIQKRNRKERWQPPGEGG